MGQGHREQEQRRIEAAAAVPIVAAAGDTELRTEIDTVLQAAAADTAVVAEAEQEVEIGIAAEEVERCTRCCTDNWQRGRVRLRAEQHKDWRMRQQREAVERTRRAAVGTAVAGYTAWLEAHRQRAGLAERTQWEPGAAGIGSEPEVDASAGRRYWHKTRSPQLAAAESHTETAVEQPARELQQRDRQQALLQRLQLLDRPRW